MSLGSSPQPDGSQQPYRRLKLVMSTSDQQHNSQTPRQSTDGNVKEESSRSSSPARPSYSPVTPTLSHTSAPGQDGNEPDWIEEPTPLPVSLDENPDAIALQATLSLLQMQRQQSLRDIRGLNKIKQEALEDPTAFVEDLKSGKLSKPPITGVVLDPDVEDSDEEDKLVKQDESRFGKLPTGQNIARCPPIEWSKYRIVGEPLDRIYELQRQYPGVMEEALARGFQPQTYDVAAPYRPFSDKLTPSTPTNETRNYDK